MKITIYVFLNIDPLLCRNAKNGNTADHHTKMSLRPFIHVSHKYLFVYPQYNVVACVVVAA